jgi:hypothetical protein
MVLSFSVRACRLAVRADGDQLRARREGGLEGGFGGVVVLAVGGDVVDAAVGALDCSGDFHRISLVGSPGPWRLRGEDLQSVVQSR